MATALLTKKKTVLLCFFLHPCPSVGRRPFAPNPSVSLFSLVCAGAREGHFPQISGIRNRRAERWRRFLAVATDDDWQFFLPANKRVDTLAARIYTSHNLLLCSQHSPFDIGFKRETKKSLNNTAISFTEPNIPRQIIQLTKLAHLMHFSNENIYSRSLEWSPKLRRPHLDLVIHTQVNIESKG